ncbi:hypothetical protein [Shewanella psychrophila]|uniref:hypothetical protein n=1 Tax=Shewanella psychrophila TaxID=225848 RepID=UPI0011EA5381|nr:hypothetical protein [Shewanella psychrophila]
MELDTQQKQRAALEVSMSLAITSAEKVSKRAGIGWVLLDENSLHIHSEAIIAGTNYLSLTASINRYAHVVHTLIVTLWPLESLFDCEELASSLVESSCQKIIVPVMDFDMQSFRASPLGRWQGEIESVDFLHATRRIGSGLNMVLSSHRPWVSSVSIADNQDKSLRLEDFRGEFGFVAYIDEIAKQSRAVVYSPSQKGFIEQLSDRNYANEYQEFYEATSIEGMRTLLKYFASEHRCSVLVLTEDKMQSALMENKLTDEVICHLPIHDKPVSKLTELASLPTEGWQLNSNTDIGACSRLILMPEKSQDAHTPMQSH